MKIVFRASLRDMMLGVNSEILSEEEERFVIFCVAV